jgi:hypothetical protein
VAQSYDSKFAVIAAANRDINYQNKNNDIGILPQRKDVNQGVFGKNRSVLEHREDVIPIMNDVYVN